MIFFLQYTLATIIADNSSESSSIIPDEFGEQLTRDQKTFLHTESLQILQISRSILVLLLFSSPHSFSVGFRSVEWNGHGRNFILGSVTHFCVDFDVCFSPNLAEAVRFWFFFILICWYLLESMYLNKMSRTSSKK